MNREHVSTDQLMADLDFQTRFPPAEFPGLYLPADEFRRRKRRQQQADEFVVAIQEHPDLFRDVTMDLIAEPLGELLAEIHKKEKL